MLKLYELPSLNFIHVFGRSKGRNSTNPVPLLGPAKSFYSGSLEWHRFRKSLKTSSGIGFEVLKLST